MPHRGTEGLGKDPTGEKLLERYSGARFQFFPEVPRKPLEDFMQVREIIKSHAIKSFAGIFPNLTQYVI